MCRRRHEATRRAVCTTAEDALRAAPKWVSVAAESHGGRAHKTDAARLQRRCEVGFRAYRTSLPLATRCLWMVQRMGTKGVEMSSRLKIALRPLIACGTGGALECGDTALRPTRERRTTRDMIGS